MSWDNADAFRARLKRGQAGLDTAIRRASQAGIPVGVGSGDDPDQLADSAARGASWLAMGGDCNLLIRGAVQAAGRIRDLNHPDREAT